MQLRRRSNRLLSYGGQRVYCVNGRQDKHDAVDPCSGGAGEFSKGRREPMPWIGIQPQFVVAEV